MRNGTAICTLRDAQDGGFTSHTFCNLKGVCMKKLTRLLLIGAMMLISVAPCVSRAQTTSTRVGVSGTRFIINGNPAFLLGVSYFDARYWRASNLDGLRARRYNLIRIWLERSRLFQQ